MTLDRETILRIALVGFNATREGYNGECAYDGLEPTVKQGFCEVPSSVPESDRHIIENLERHLVAAGLLEETA